MATNPRTNQLAQTGATTGQAVVWDGTKWLPASVILPTIVDAKGDLLVGTADNTIARLASSGVNDQALVVDTSTSTGLKWAAQFDSGAIHNSLVDAKGDLIAGTADNTVTRL